MRESRYEKMHRETFSEDIRDKVQVSLKYQDYVRIMNSHLRDIYGERADWAKCISAYFRSSAYRAACNNGNTIGKISTLCRADIDKMILEEEQYLKAKEELLTCYHSMTKTQSGTAEELHYTMQMAKILGVLPEENVQSLYQWNIQRKNMSYQDRDKLSQSVIENKNILNLIVTSAAKRFHDGLQLVFPNVGCVMTKPSSRYFYRGENAYFKSSKASMFRNSDSTPVKIRPIINHLKYIECFRFLDRMDVVKYWNASEVNYLALAQHYGLKTQMIDITSNLKIALFFACCRYGEDRKWHPLGEDDCGRPQDDFEHVNSRKGIARLGGDSRYGILYRTPTEITEMKWAISDNDAGFEIITPVGYQPFMRCSHQDAYMLIARDERYDLLCDPMFEKYKIRLDKDLCEWIYEEMDKGRLIYPNDLLNIELAMESINEKKVFTESAFQDLCKAHEFRPKAARALLAEYGYSTKNGIDVEDKKRLAQINSHYTVQDAIDRVGVLTPISSPLVMIPSDALVNEDGKITMSQ